MIFISFLGVITGSFGILKTLCWYSNLKSSDFNFIYYFFTWFLKTIYVTSDSIFYHSYGIFKIFTFCN